MDEALVLVSILVAFVLTTVSIPPIIRVSNAKHLFDEIDRRKVHKSKIPTLGGAAIFMGLIISTLVAENGFELAQIKYLLAGIILVFFIGLKDDILILAPKKKLLVEVLAACIIIFLGDFRFTSLHGILGVYEIGYFWSVLLSLIAIIGITNAYNLIDGIDGLASGVAMVATLFFGVWFYLSGYPEYAVLSFALLGSLVAFFRFNVFGKKNKLFMGDSGSLIIGLLISALVIRFNELNLLPGGLYNVKAAPAISLAVIIVPVIDTLRVFFLRILKGHSPFKPDKNHVHHWLLSLTNNHLKTTVIIVSVNILIIATGIMICQIPMNINFKFIFIGLLGTGLAGLPWLLVNHRRKTSVGFRKIEVKASVSKSA